MLLVAIIFVLGAFGIFNNDILSSMLIQVVVMFAIPLVMYTLLVSKNVKTSFKDAGIKKISGKMVLIAVALGFVMYFINSFVADAFSSILSLFGYENIYSAGTVKLNYSFLFKEFVLSAILPGICEEFLHRGLLLSAGKKTGNTRLCLFISSILFGLMHLNINQFFYASILGFLMGYVALISDSIIPTMIIHFMNNFLSSYFYYGKYMNWPVAVFANYISKILSSNVLLFTIITTASVLALISLFILLTRAMLRERAKNDAIKIINALKLENLTIIEAQQRINQANIILENSKSAKFSNTVKAGKNANFVDKIFMYSSLVLGGIITISSFIWGII